MDIVQQKFVPRGTIINRSSLLEEREKALPTAPSTHTVYIRSFMTKLSLTKCQISTDCAKIEHGGEKHEDRGSERNMIYT